jgi:hypothetical protein
MINESDVQKKINELFSIVDKWHKFYGQIITFQYFVMAVMLLTWFITIILMAV